MAMRHIANKISAVIFGTLVQLELGFLAMSAPGLSQTQPQPTLIPVQSSGGQLLNQLVPQWGFNLVPCTTGVASIIYNAEKACVTPTPQLPAGEYTYESTTNQVTPLNSQVATPKFTFTSVLDYSNCLEAILQLYQNGTLNSQQQNSCVVHSNQQLSKSQALELISGANFYATNMLERKLYPPRGQRRRVAQIFQFIYDIDVSDSEMQKLATQSYSNSQMDRPQ
ncbi:hypothetical protein [Gloeocapsopsis dulcis]|uniref:Uncharacterized protein n=1 Tax=Gloeocapsopsis dulcis AAB1 = 1H9 TaxID=1433147 RepID=A0A6N8FZM5_9CHRO|nr:hypothetical protein [Gloeocapsopsis dulcis]MUL38411.1 hypothetical protein [Gloeocapsopsis dulcis AAB1 = 1H9]WNN89197.1 hypothetical protein P0S91_23630 [Gloeocapsopsis dulcis]